MENPFPVSIRNKKVVKNGYITTICICLLKLSAVWGIFLSSDLLKITDTDGRGSIKKEPDASGSLKVLSEDVHRNSYL